VVETAEGASSNRLHDKLDDDRCFCRVGQLATPVSNQEPGFE
jgi:hypothetical protein